MAPSTPTTSFIFEGDSPIRGPTTTIASTRPYTLPAEPGICLRFGQQRVRDEGQMVFRPMWPMPVSRVLNGQVARLENGRITPPTREANSPTTVRGQQMRRRLGVNPAREQLAAQVDQGGFSVRVVRRPEPSPRQVREMTSNSARLRKLLSGQIPGHNRMRLLGSTIE